MRLSMEKGANEKLIINTKKRRNKENRIIIFYSIEKDVKGIIIR